MTRPHASWASCYDLIYDQSFGHFYHALTNETVEQISKVVQVPARIVDFGAGTGRLSIPLSSYGYDVVAVEPSSEMLDQLSNKPGGDSIATFNGKMHHFQTDTPFDLALCVFTVLLYLLDEDSLRKSMQAAFNALKPNGHLLIDIPSRVVFSSLQKNTDIMQRKVTISPIQDDIYQYDENTTLAINGEANVYVDRFNIRYWNVEFVQNILMDVGFSLAGDMSAEFAGTGSQYFLMKKNGNS